MISDAQKSGVIKFYDTHPINEVEILAKLAARGVSSNVLTEDEYRTLRRIAAPAPTHAPISRSHTIAPVARSSA